MHIGVASRPKTLIERRRWHTGPISIGPVEAIKAVPNESGICRRYTTLINHWTTLVGGDKGRKGDGVIPARYDENGAVGFIPLCLCNVPGHFGFPRRCPITLM